MSSHLTVNDHSRQGGSSQSSGRSSPLTIFPGGDFTLPKPPPKPERSGFGAISGRISSMLHRGRRGVPASGLLSDNRDFGVLNETRRQPSPLGAAPLTTASSNTPPLATAPSGTPPLATAPLNTTPAGTPPLATAPSSTTPPVTAPPEQDESLPPADSEVLRAEVERIRGDALQAARQMVLASSPLFIEISTNKLLPPTDDPDWLFELRFRIAEIFDHSERDVHITVDTPVYSLFGQAEDYYLAKVTAADGVLSVEQHRAQTTALLALLADRLRVAHPNGVVRYTNVNEESLARNFRTMGESIEYEAELIQEYIQPNQVPQRRLRQRDQVHGAQPPVVIRGDNTSLPHQSPSLRSHSSGGAVETCEIPESTGPCVEDTSVDAEKSTGPCVEDTSVDAQKSTRPVRSGSVPVNSSASSSRAEKTPNVEPPKAPSEESSSDSCGSHPLSPEEFSRLSTEGMFRAMGRSGRRHDKTAKRRVTVSQAPNEPTANSSDAEEEWSAEKRAEIRAGKRPVREDEHNQSREQSPSTRAGKKPVRNNEVNESSVQPAKNRTGRRSVRLIEGNGPSEQPARPGPGASRVTLLRSLASSHPDSDQVFSRYLEYNKKPSTEEPRQKQKPKKKSQELRKHFSFGKRWRSKTVGAPAGSSNSTVATAADPANPTDSANPATPTTPNLPRVPGRVLSKSKTLRRLTGQFRRDQ